MRRAGYALIRVIEQASCLNSSAGNEEPLVDTAVNRSRWEVLTRGNLGELGLVDAVGGVLVGDVGTSFRISFLQ